MDVTLQSLSRVACNTVLLQREACRASRLEESGFKHVSDTFWGINVL